MHVIEVFVIYIICTLVFVMSFSMFILIEQQCNQLLVSMVVDFHVTYACYLLYTSSPMRALLDVQCIINPTATCRPLIKIDINSE